MSNCATASDSFEKKSEDIKIIKIQLNQSLNKGPKKKLCERELNSRFGVTISKQARFVAELTLARQMT